MPSIMTRGGLAGDVVEIAMLGHDPVIPPATAFSMPRRRASGCGAKAALSHDCEKYRDEDGGPKVVTNSDVKFCTVRVVSSSYFPAKICFFVVRLKSTSVPSICKIRDQRIHFIGSPRLPSKLRATAFG